jgi:hypothetical protein
MSCPVKECPHKKSPCESPSSACESEAWSELRQARERITELEGALNTMIAHVEKTQCPSDEMLRTTDCRNTSCAECWKQWAMKGGEK